MSIPRFAIQRPVTMFMLSAVIMLLGLLSLSKLPVDLMPEFEQPTLTVRVDLRRCRPARDGGADHAADGTGGQRRSRPDPRRLDVVGGQQPGPLNFDVGSPTSPKRLTKCAPASIASAAACRKTPTPRRFSSSTRTRRRSCSSVSRATSTRSRCANWRENEIAPRFERVDGVAAVTVGRRPAPPDSHRSVEGEDPGAQPSRQRRSCRRSATENQNTPLGEINQGDRTFLVRSQGQFQSIEDIRNLVVMTRRRACRSTCATSPTSVDTHRAAPAVHAHQRQAAASSMQIQKQSGTNTVAVVDGVRAELARVNARGAGRAAADPQDTSMFITPRHHNVQEHAVIGGMLVIADHLRRSCATSGRR